MERPEPHDARALARLVARLHARLGEAEREALAPLGLTPAAFRLLESLVREGPGEPTVVARRLALSQPALTASINALVGAGLVERGRVPGDGRRARLDVTAAGAYRYELAGDEVRRAQTRLVARIDPGLQAALLRALSAIEPEPGEP